MYRAFLAWTVVSISLVGCAGPVEQRPTTNRVESSITTAKVEGTPFGDFVIADPVTYKNLTIFPICSKEPKNEDRFITLDEGMAAGTVRIVEVGAETSGIGDSDPFTSSDNPSGSGQGEVAGDPVGSQRETPQQTSIGATVPTNNSEAAQSVTVEPAGEVNTLLVYNTSGRPLYLMPGEVISGGKQDRTIGEEVVIESTKEPVAIDVFCVEVGRWSGRSISSTSQLLASADQLNTNLSLIISQDQDADELARQAQRGNFVTSVGQLSKDVRLAVQDKQNQSDVWNEVAKANARLGNKTETGTFAAAYFDREVDTDLSPYLDALQPVAARDQIVGVVVAVDGKILSADWFASTPLFRKFWLKLLKSYALDAVASNFEHDNDDTKQPTVCSVEDGLAFLKDISESKAESSERDDGQQVVRRHSERAVSFSYYDREAAKLVGAAGEPIGGGAGFGGGGFGGAVHGGAFPK